jgi:hypothetical protein
MSGSLPRQSHARNHSHSVSSGSLIPAHRVTRRKSVSSNAVSNVAAMIAAVRDAGDTSLGMPISTRRSTSKSARSAVGSLPSPPASLHGHRIRLTSGAKLERNESAIDDDQNDEDMDEDEETGFKQARLRRASEGQHLIKDGKKSNPGDLKCDKCGKGYKHSSCLSKHLFVHTLFLPLLHLSTAFEAIGRTLVNFFIADGSTLLSGHTHRNYLFRSTSRSSFWRPLLYF